MPVTWNNRCPPIQQSPTENLHTVFLHSAAWGEALTIVNSTGRLPKMRPSTSWCNIKIRLKRKEAYGEVQCAGFTLDSLKRSRSVAYRYETWPRTSSLFNFYTNKQDTLQYNQRSRQGDLYHYFEYALNYARSLTENAGTEVCRHVRSFKGKGRL